MLVKIVGGLYRAICIRDWKRHRSLLPRRRSRRAMPFAAACWSICRTRNRCCPRCGACRDLPAGYGYCPQAGHRRQPSGNRACLLCRARGDMSRQAVRTRYFAMKLYLDRFAAAVLQVRNLSSPQGKEKEGGSGCQRLVGSLNSATAPVCQNSTRWPAENLPLRIRSMRPAAAFAE